MRGGGRGRRSATERFPKPLAPLRRRCRGEGSPLEAANNRPYGYRQRVRAYLLGDNKSWTSIAAWHATRYAPFLPSTKSFDIPRVRTGAGVVPATINVFGRLTPCRSFARVGALRGQAPTRSAMPALCIIAWHRGGEGEEGGGDGGGGDAKGSEPSHSMVRPASTTNYHNSSQSTDWGRWGRGGGDVVYS